MPGELVSSMGLPAGVRCLGVPTASRSPLLRAAAALAAPAACCPGSQPNFFTLQGQLLPDFKLQ